MCYPILETGITQVAHLMTNGRVFRTAPDTLGLLIIGRDWRALVELRIPKIEKPKGFLFLLRKRIFLMRIFLFCFFL